MLAPHTHAPFSEAMLFGIAGGIGMGVFSFYYQKEDIATFFLAGRHKWHDDAAYLSDTLGLFGIQPVIHETAGAKAAEHQLRDTLDRYGPCIAWVDLAELPHRAMPSAWSGGGYHVITVYSVDDTDGTAQIGDLTDEPISISLADLARARARIKKQRHRLLALPQAGQRAGSGNARAIGVAALPRGTAQPIAAGRAQQRPPRRAANLGRAHARRQG